MSMGRVWGVGFTIGLTCLLVGCTSTTKITGPESDALAEAHSVPLQLVELTDRTLQEQVSFLGRYLLSDTYRVSVAENAAESDWGRLALVDLMKYRAIGDSTLLGMAVSQAATGDLLSTRGDSLAFWSSIGIDFVNMLLATSQMSDVSGFYMPDTFEGVTVETPEHATELAIAFTASRIQDAVRNSGYEIACIKQCEPDSRGRIYQLSKVAERPDIFAPAVLYLYWGFFDLVLMPEKSEEYLLSPLLGFVPKYASPIGNTWTVFLGTELRHNKSTDTFLIDPHSRLVTTPLSREIRRALYSGQRFMFWGSAVAHIRSRAFYIKEKQPGLIYFDDQIYAFPDHIGKIMGESDTVSVTHTVQ